MGMPRQAVGGSNIEGGGSRLLLKCWGKQLWQQQCGRGQQHAVRTSGLAAAGINSE